MTIGTLTAILAATIISQINQPSLTVIKPVPPVTTDQGKLIDARSVLEKGRSAGAMPEGMVVRISACLGAAEKNAGAEVKGLVELIEVTPGKVHRVEHHSEGGKPVYKRIESREFDSKSLCKDLLEGRAIEIASRQGTGPVTVLADSIYRLGSRSIKVEWNGQTILDLYETNGPFLDGYRETDARAFGKLYERIAEQARSAMGNRHSDSK